MSEQIPMQSQAREDLCRFLAACYYEPSTAFAEERLFASMAVAAQVLDPSLAVAARKLAEAFDSQELQVLLIDYTRLFLGPMQPLAHPYGTSWLGGDPTLKQASLDGLLELYGQAGFEVDDELRELPDHVAIELEFLYLLKFKKNQALQSGDGEELDLVAQLERRFVDEHLRPWLAPFTEAVASNAETDFYKELAVFTLQCLEREA